MSATDFVKAGFRFNYCVGCVMPQIPYVQDVLFALRLSDKCEEYEFALSNHEPYVTNVHLVAACMCEALCEHPHSFYALSQKIAQVIVDLCPDEARCVLYGSDAYIMAMKEAGLEAPAHDPTTCPRCIEHKKHDDASGDGWDDDDDDPSDVSLD